jgi:MATE family multidrug resistance protein
MQLGMGSAVETLCGQAYGANKFDMLGVYMQRSTVLLMATGVPLAVLYVFSRPLLILLGESPEIARAAAIWRKMEPKRDDIAVKGLANMKKFFGKK